MIGYSEKTHNVLFLTKDFICLVDQDVYGCVSHRKWRFEFSQNNRYRRFGYAVRTTGTSPDKTTLYLHREIFRIKGIQIPDGYVVNHKSHILQKYNIVDNRISNLELVTQRDNLLKGDKYGI